MKLNMSLRMKIFLIAVCIIVIGQVIYSKKNVDSFQKSYLEALQDKCEKLGGLLKNDVEYVVNLNIPLSKLIKLERTLQEILIAIPELEFVEITDLKGYVLYYADHKSLGRVKPGTRLSATQREEEVRSLENLGMSSDDVDIVLPVFYQKKNQHVGDIRLRLSSDLIVSKSREILLDMITVILTSLLITFEFLTFFAAYSISEPLKTVTTDIRRSIFNKTPLSGRSYIFMSELGNVIEVFNNFMVRLLKNLNPYSYTQQFFPKVQERLRKTINRQLKEVKYFLYDKSSDQSTEPAAPKNPALNSALEQMSRMLVVLQERIDIYAMHLISHLPASDTSNRREKSRSPSVKFVPIPYFYIRPLIFLFVMADGFCASFFPIFVDTLYEPMWGLSKEVVIGLPISFFMLSFALSMPLAGSWSDSTGWYKPLLIGILFNAVGLILTAMAQDIYYLLLFRSITAIGFGVVYMACQQFVYDNTFTRNRTLGMASFLAAFFAGDICGTVVGGMLADRIGYRNVFLVSGVVSLFAFVSCLLIFKNDFRSAQKKDKSEKMRAPFSIKDIFRVLKDREFFAVIFLQAIPAKLTLIGFLFYFVPLYLKNIGTLQSNIGRVIMCYGVALVFIGPLFSRFLDKASHRKYYIFTGGMITGLSMISFYFFSGFGPLLFLVAALGLAHTFSVSSQSSLIMETAIVKKIGTGTGMGLFRFWERVGNVAGPLVMGFLIARVGYELSVVALGFISIIGSLIYIILISIRKQKKPA